MKIYLAGPISGCSYKECTEWRKGVETDLMAHGFSVASPMRGKEFLKNVRSINPLGYSKYDASATSEGIFQRDKFDVTKCDILLAFLVGSKRVSIGTLMEIAWAHLLGKYVVTVMQPDDVHNHAFVNEASSIVLPNLEVAVAYIIDVFGEKCSAKDSQQSK